MRKSVYTSLFTLLAFWIVASFAQAAQIVTEIKDGAKVYIRYKAGTANAPVYYYINAGSISGTTLMMDYHGIEFTLSKNGTNNGLDVYALHASVSNKAGTDSNNRYVIWESDRFKCDKGKGKSTFTFEKIDDSSNNLYWLKYSDTKLKPNGIDANISIANDNNDIQWEVVTKEQLMKEMEAATGTNPVDATFFISDPGFDTNRNKDLKAKWKIVNASNGSSKDLVETYTPVGDAIDQSKVFTVGETKIMNYTHAWKNDNANNSVQGKKSSVNITTTDNVNGMYKVQQTLTGLPAGKYRIVAQGVSDVEDACYLFASNGYTELGKNAFKSKSDLGDDMAAYDLYTADDAYKNSIEVYVFGGTLTIGVKNESAIASKAYVDNFELYYLGSSIPTNYNATAADYTPSAVSASPWIEVTSSESDVVNHPEKYFFTIWSDATTLLGGMDGLAGGTYDGYKTMGCYSNVNPLDSLVYLWELYRVGTSGYKYVFVNPTSRENMLQAETDSRFFLFNESTVQNTANATVTLAMSRQNRNWTLKTSTDQYIHPWSPVITDATQANFKIYAIPRTSVVVDDNADTSFDASLLIANPDATGTNGTTAGFGWNVTGDVNTESPVTGEDGRKSCFTFPTSATGSLSQTLSGMHAGRYILTAHVIGGSGTLFIGDAETTITGAGTFEVEKNFEADGDISFGARGSSESALQIDYFTLMYSVSKDFYVRNNIGTESAPEYIYVSGGTHSSNAIMAKHGTEFTSVSYGVSSLSGFEDSQSVVFKTGTYTSSGNIGYFGLDANNKYAVNLESANKSLMLLKPVDATNKYYYMYSASNNKYVGGSNTLYSDLTQSNSATTPFELVSRSQLLDELRNASATPLTPVDATFLIDDPDFSKGNMKKSSWKVSNGTTTYDLDGTERVYMEGSKNITIQNYGNNNNFVRIVVYPNQPTGRYYVQQTLTGLPKGYYRLSAQGIGRLGATGSIAGSISMYLFAKNGEGTETSEKFEEQNYFTEKSTASQIETKFKENNYENYKKTIEVYVGDDGNLTIGAKTGNKGNAAYVFDNFELYYIGEKSSSEEFGFNLFPVTFDVSALGGNIVEVKSKTDDAMVNPQNYFFTIWENSTTCLALADGTSGYQGEDYKTMSFVSNPDLTTDLSCLWEFDKTADGKYVMINATDREHMMQTEEDANFFRYRDVTALDVAKASVEFQTGSYNNWTVKSPNGYLHRWEKDCADIAVDKYVGYHKIYAIPRSYYVMDVLRAKYGAYSGNPKDVTLLLANPDAAGTSGNKTIGIPGWNKSGSGDVMTKEGDSDTFSYINGKSFFEVAQKTQISQTLSNLLAGKYRLSVPVKSRSTLFVTVKSQNKTFKVDGIGTLSLEFECGKNDVITYGIKVETVRTADFDNFRLYYLGDPNHIYADPLKAGEEYYIRALNSEGEYRYLEAGNAWGTAAVFTEHGIEYRFDDAQATQGEYPLYYLYTGVGAVNGGRNYLSVDDSGKLYNDWPKKGWYFIPRGDDYPFQYRMVYKDNGKNVTYDESITAAGPNLDFTDTETYVEIVPKYVRMIALEDESVSYTNPVDATFLIKNPSFGKNDIRISEWKANVGTDTVSMAFYDNALTIGDVNFLNGSGASPGNSDIYSMKVSSKDGVTDNVSFNFFQKITDVPNGHYIISASGVSTKAEALRMYVTDSKNAVLGQAVFVDTDEDSNFKNVSLNVNYEAFNQFFNNNNQNRKTLSRKSFAFDVKDSTMVIGFRGTAKEFKAFFDNIELKYCGPTTEIVVTNLPGNNFKPEKVGSKWVEVSKLGSDGPLDNPGDYLFTIWKDNKTCLALDNGTDAYQGSSYKTMAYTNVTADPINNLNQLWEIYQNDYGVKDGKFVLVNASSREMMMQAEEGTEYFRFRELVSQKNDKAVVCINDTILGNGSYIKFKITSDCSNRELGRWSSNVADVKMVDANGDYYKLYAIKRADYYTVKDNIFYTASILTPIDVSLLMSNPDAMGEVGQKKMYGWKNPANEMQVSDPTVNSFPALNGKKYFGYSGAEQPTTVLTQTINNLPRGYYLLNVYSTCVGTNAKLYAHVVGTKEGERLTEELSFNDIQTRNVLVPFYLEKDNGSVNVGVDMTGYQEAEGSTTNNVQFDHFSLQYMGVTEVLASALSEGTYYIRTNLNRDTDKSPEYRYLDAGGNGWGTDPILSEHGMSLVLKKNNGSTTYSITGELYQGGDHGRLFDGLHFDHKRSEFNFEKVKPDDDNSFEYWMKSCYANTNVDNVDAITPSSTMTINGSTVTYTQGGYVVKTVDGTLGILESSTAPLGEQSAVWEIVTKTQRVKELQDASYDNPMDATFFITDPSFGRNNEKRTSWKFNGTTLPSTLGNNSDANNKQTFGNFIVSVGSETPSGAEHSNKYDFNMIIKGNTTAKSSYNLSQQVKLDNLPAGVYRLSVHGYTNVDKGAFLYAADENGELGNTPLHRIASDTPIDILSNHNYAAYWFTGNEYMANKDKLLDGDKAKYKLSTYNRADKYIKTIEVKVTTNTLTIGVRGELSSNEYAVLDNFELYYLGEAAHDLTKMPVGSVAERYLYNAESGLYLSEGDQHLSVVNSFGKKFNLEKVGDKKYYIYTENNGTKSYLSPTTYGDAINYVIVNSTVPYEWTIEPESKDNDYLYLIKDKKNRIYEWCGDAGNVIFVGFPEDEEPRGVRWAFYEPGQYQKDRIFTSLTTTVRSDMWRVLSSAQVNFTKLTGDYAIEGLKEAYEKLDAIWVNPMSSANILKQKANDLKIMMIESMAVRGSEPHPVDVSFFIQNAGLGKAEGWTDYDKWSVTSGQNRSYGSNSNKNIVSIEKFLYRNGGHYPTLSQTIKDVPAGKYKLAIDLRTRPVNKVDVPASADLFMATKNVAGEQDLVKLVISDYYDETVDRFETEDCIELTSTQDLTIGIKQLAGSIAFDNFKLYFCGNTNGKLQFNDDYTELTVSGTWTEAEDVSSTVKNTIAKYIDKLGTVYVYKDNFTLDKNINATEAGWQKGTDTSKDVGNNILFYTDYDELTGNCNIVRKAADGSFTCDKLVITDKMTMHVPYEFTATTVSYSRANPVSTGTLCLPFDLTKMPEGINSFFVPNNIDWEASPTYGKVTFVACDNGSPVLPANTPVLYNGVANGTINVAESNALIHRTSELAKPNPDETDITMFGTYKSRYVIGQEGVLVDSTKNYDGLCADVCYYVKDNNRMVRGNKWFTIGAFRAFVYRGKNNTPPSSARSSVLYIDFDDLYNGVEDLNVEDADIVGYYDVKGVHYDKPQKGFNVILYSDGTRRKVCVK